MKILAMKNYVFRKFLERCKRPDEAFAVEEFEVKLVARALWAFKVKWCGL